MGSVLGDKKLSLDDGKQKEDTKDTDRKDEKERRGSSGSAGSRAGSGAGVFTNPGFSGDLDLGDIDDESPDNEVGGVSKGTTSRYKVDDFTVDGGEDILNFVEGAIPRAMGLAILQEACVLAGYKPGSKLFAHAKGAILTWLVINTASGNHDFSKIVYVKGNEKYPFPTKRLQDAMRKKNVDELRRVGVALLPEQKALVDRNSSVREYIAQLNGIRDLSKAWLGIDSVWKLPGVSTRDAAMAKKYAKARIARAKIDGKTSSSVADDMFAVDEGSLASVVE